MREPRAGLGPLSREAGRRRRGARSGAGSRPHPSQGGVTVGSDFWKIIPNCRPRPAALCAQQPLQVAASNYIRDALRHLDRGPLRAETAPTSLTRERPVACPLARFAVATRNYCNMWRAVVSETVVLRKLQPAFRRSNIPSATRGPRRGLSSSSISKFESFQAAWSSL